MINLKELKKLLVENMKFIEWNPKECRENVDKRITIKRKKKMIIEKLTNGNVKAVRRNYIKIEIIE